VIENKVSDEKKKDRVSMGTAGAKERKTSEGEMFIYLYHSTRF